MLQMPLAETPSLLRSGMLCMSGGDGEIPCDTPEAGGGQPVRTPTSRLSLFSLSSAPGDIGDATDLGIGMSSSPLRGLFGPASAVKLLQSPLAPQPLQVKLQTEPLQTQPQPQPQPQPQSQPQPQKLSRSQSKQEPQLQAQPQDEPQQPSQSQLLVEAQPLQHLQPQLQPNLQADPQPQLLPSAQPAVGTATTSPVSSRPATPLSAHLAVAHTAAFEGACASTGNRDVAAAVAAAAQSAFLAAYFSGNSQTMAPRTPIPASAPVLAPTTAAPVPATTSTFPSTFDAVIAALSDEHPTTESADQGMEISDPLTAVAAAPSAPAAVVMSGASPLAAGAMHTIASVVPDGGVATEVLGAPRPVAVGMRADTRGVEDDGLSAKGLGSPVITTPPATATAGVAPKATTPISSARLWSVGRRSSMPTSERSQRRTSMPAGLPFTVFCDSSMPPPQPRTPRSAVKALMRFGDSPARSPLAENSPNVAAGRRSPAVNVVGLKKATEGVAGGGGGGEGGLGGDYIGGGFTGVGRVGRGGGGGGEGGGGGGGGDSIGGRDTNKGGGGRGSDPIGGRDTNKPAVAPPVAVSSDGHKVKGTVAVGAGYASETKTRYEAIRLVYTWQVRFLKILNGTGRTDTFPTARS